MASNAITSNKMPVNHPRVNVDMFIFDNLPPRVKKLLMDANVNMDTASVAKACEMMPQQGIINQLRFLEEKEIKLFRSEHALPPNEVSVQRYYGTISLVEE